MNCPCGLNIIYDKCCGVAHKSLKKAKTAESLMRSRYTAFTMADGDYLMRSHHSSTRPIKEKNEIVAWAKSVCWVKLEIIATTGGEQNENKGTVAFKAYFVENGVLNHIYENSQFIKEDNHWTYLGFVE